MLRHLREYADSIKNDPISRLNQISNVSSNVVNNQLVIVSQRIKEILKEYVHFVKMLHDIQEETQAAGDIEISEVVSLTQKIAALEKRIEKFSSRFD